MSHRWLIALTLAALVASHNEPAAEQRPRGSGTQGRRAAPTVAVAGGAVIRGRVIAADTGSPIRRAEIRITPVKIEPVIVADLTDTATTDDEGRYELRDLPSGQYELVVTKSGFVTWQFGQRRPFDVVPPITLTTGQRFTADVTLWRGGAIAGRIYDEFGEALEAVRVNVFRARMLYGRRHLETVGAYDQSDDSGAFRVYGLPPGDYYVGASLRVAPPDSFVETTYAPTYFPGTGSVAEAQRVTLALGTEVTADFPLLPVRPVRVSGTIFNSSGAPANAFLNLTSEASEVGAPDSVGGVTRADGTFTLPDVAPGRYVLNASLRQSGAGEVAALPVTVGSDDLAGITLVTSKPATLRGTLVADTGAGRALPQGLGVILRAAREGRRVLGGGAGSEFEIEGLGEPFWVEIERLQDWSIKSIIVNNVDVTDSPIDLRGVQQAVARIVLTDRGAEIRGIVKSGSASGLHVVVFPDDPAKWVYPSRYVRSVQSQKTGAFRIAGLPADDKYRAVAVDYLEDGEAYDPDFLAKMKDVATQFALADGERRTVDLELVER